MIALRGDPCKPKRFINGVFETANGREFFSNFSRVGFRMVCMLCFNLSINRKLI